ncbi:BA75_02029T0 [Komagataella pastoris]|uniref:BA75_02029T0 n=1 Tax=Komagataella pastoris TaxID=4922 RepID=A0A1B2JBB6_PICPA|nr:BA75_02029T0 [Komagataella pastoris]
MQSTLIEDKKAQKHEEKIAENILRRAELTRITQQLKSKLSKVGRLATMDSEQGLRGKKAFKPNGLPIAIASSGVNEGSLNPEHQERQKSHNSSPAKRDLNANNLPSSPVYSYRTSDLSSKLGNSFDNDDTSLTNPPSTPPRKHETLTLSSKNEAQVALQNAILATPKSKVISRSANLKTPSGNSGPKELDDGADLLMFLATSPSPSRPGNHIQSHTNAQLQGIVSPRNHQTQLQNVNSTPPRQKDRSFGTPLGLPSSYINRFNMTPGTPRNSGQLKGLQRTPGFSMSDYVNFFTPSPRQHKTPDVNYSNIVTSNISVQGTLLNFDRSPAHQKLMGSETKTKENRTTKDARDDESPLKKRKEN